MSEKKSPPHKDKASSSKPLQADSKSNKRKLATPSSPTEEDDKKNQQQQQKRKRPNVPEGSSPEHMGIGSPRGAGTVSRLSVPLSERQQMALLMRMQDESSVGDVSPKSPSSGNQVSSTKRTPADKKVNKRNERGEAPLHMAAKKGDYKQTKRLLKAGASVNMKDYAGWTALHEACNSGNLRVARCLLKAGADVNVQGFDDDTPLHDASVNGHRKLVQLLLRHGANPHQANLKGKTALTVAATSEIEALLRGNSASYSSDLDSNSDASSSDSNLSSKEDERSNIDDDYKAQGTPGKPDVMSSSGPSATISSSLGPTSSSSVGSVGSLGARRQSVPPSPDKMAASPRLIFKLQHKKSSSSSSSTTDEQQRVSEWNVLPLDSGCEVTSEGDLTSRPSTERPVSSTARPSKPEDNWSRLISTSSGAKSSRGGAVDGDGCPDSTVAPSAPLTLHPSPLERTATEPFTPRGLEPLGNSDNEEEHSDVFSSSVTNSIKTSNTFSSPCSSQGTSNEIMKQQPLPPPSSSQQQSSQQHLFQSLQQQHQQHYHAHQLHQQTQQQQQQQQQQHIPGQTISTYHGVRQNSTKSPNMVQTLPSSSFGSEQSGVSSSSSPSSSHRTSGSSCQFSLVSSSSSLPSSTSASSLSVLGPGLSSQHQSHPPHHLQSGPPMSTPSSSHLPDSRPGTMSSSLPFQPYPARGVKGGGSIVTGLSDRAMAATGGAVTSISTIPPSATAPPPNLPWEAGRLPIPRLEEKSDTSSCDSPLRVDLEDSNPAPSDQGSRPSTPKVPPLKIIMPPKVGGPSTNISKPQAKPALPYVLNPTTESEGWDGIEEGGQRTLSSSSLSVPEGGDYSSSPLPRPSSRAGSGVGVTSSEMAGKLSDLVGTAPRNLDGEDTASRESDTRAEQTDGSGEKSDEGKEKRPTRTLRSHTAMMQQAQQQQQKDKNPDKEKNGGLEPKDEGDNSSTTRSQKGDDYATDDSSYPPRKRKLRNKTEQQTMQVSATTAPPAKLNQPLEKPPNPYETYLNLRRQIASRHRSLCNIAPKPPSGFKDFLMVNCTYVLQGNATSTLSVPMLPPPNLVPEPMRDFFIRQEKERYRLRLQHVIEREKLMLSIEQEILREHARAARAMANQTLPFSVCTILREEEIYNQQELEQVEDRDKNVRSRYNGRQFLSWLQDVDDKYDKIKQLLLLRHHHEAESLYAVQKLDWEWKLKECGLCDHKNTPIIDDLHVPMVTVSDEFELLPSS